MNPPANSEAVKAANIIQAQFPSSNSSSDSQIIIVVQNASVYSDLLRQKVLELNSTIANDSNIGNYTGELSLYSMEATLLNESLPELISQVANLQLNITTINSGLYSLQATCQCKSKLVPDARRHQPDISTCLRHTSNISLVLGSKST